MYYLLSPYRVYRSLESIDKKFFRKTLYTENIDQWKLYIVPIFKDCCRLIVSTKKRIFAYNIYQLVRGYYTLKGILSPAFATSKEVSIYEYSKCPKLTWKKSDWLMHINKKAYNTIAASSMYKYELRGTEEILCYGEKKELQEYLERNSSTSAVIDSLSHLNESYLLFDGNIETVYPEQAYRYKIPIFNDDIIERTYYENKSKYELAFLAAFKGIERILDVNDIRKRKIKNILAKRKKEYNVRLYERKYEKYFGYEEKESYEKIIEHFLDMRNSVAAHGNKKPPTGIMITYYSIYEIQYFLENLIKDRAGI